MRHEKITLPEIQLVGIAVRTSNAKEMNQATAQIGTTIQRYLDEAIAQKIQHKKSPGKTCCVYTEYESDQNSDYTYLIGEEVTSSMPQAGLKLITVPKQTYIKFTTEPGKMPAIAISAWQTIWGTSFSDWGGRRFKTDFELYDERALDPDNAVLDICIGVNR